MADVESVAIAPKRRWPRFRLRTLILAVAILGLLFGALASVPWIMWRYHVARALEAARKEGPAVSWSALFDVTRSARRDEYLYLLSDRERVLATLRQAVEHDPEDARRVNAVQTMQALLNPPSPLALRRRYLDWAVDLTTRAQLFTALEGELAGAIAKWTSSTGVDTRQRRVILARANSAPPNLLPAWARVLAKIGGREETLALISLGDTHDPALLEAVHNSSLVSSYWPGLLPALKRGLDDPVIAPWVMRYSLLSQTPEGRDMLLAYVTAATHPMKLRWQAMERLQQTIPGINLFLNVVKDPAALKALVTSLDGDPRATFKAALTKLDERNGKALWSELIEGVETSYPNRYPNPVTDIEKAASDAEKLMRQHTRESSLNCLRWITGRTHLRTQSGWQQWYAASRPSPLTQATLVKLVLEHPEALNDGAILRRVASPVDTLPPDCVALYERMAREGTPTSQYWACWVLLLYTPKADVTPILIDLIGQGGQGDDATGSWGPTELLKHRFAENFFWETAAWREWWSEHDRQP